VLYCEDAATLAVHFTVPDVEEAEPMFERIVVSVDGSPDSDKAVEATRELARAQGSEVIVVHGRDIALVSPPAPPTPVPPPQVEPESEDEAQRLVDDAVRQLQEGGVTARGFVLPMRGRLAQHIVELAEEESAGLIVLGSRGMSRIREMVIGSVANKVIHISPVPVLLAR
jgi:nucleotide-binding universal stress UspA family protein